MRARALPTSSIERVGYDPRLLPTLPAALHTSRLGVHRGLPGMWRVASTDHQPRERLGFPSCRTRGSPHRAAPSSRRLNPGARARHTIVTDTHIRLLRVLANQSRPELVHHHSIHQVEDAASRQRGEHLERAARRTRAHLADAQARRHNRRPGAKVSIPSGITSAISFAITRRGVGGRPV